MSRIGPLGGCDVADEQATPETIREAPATPATPSLSISGVVLFKAQLLDALRNVLFNST